MRVSTLIIAALFLLPTLIGIGLNQLDPSAGSALGVAYFALLGLLLGLLGTVIVLLLSWRGSMAPPNIWLVGLCLIASLVLFLQANTGSLSLVQ